jgi:hypothetical protein
LLVRAAARGQRIPATESKQMIKTNKSPLLIEFAHWQAKYSKMLNGFAGEWEWIVA